MGFEINNDERGDGEGFAITTDERTTTDVSTGGSIETFDHNNDGTTTTPTPLKPFDEMTKEEKDQWMLEQEQLEPNTIGWRSDRLKIQKALDGMSEEDKEAWESSEAAPWVGFLIQFIDGLLPFEVMKWGLLKISPELAAGLDLAAKTSTVDGWGEFLGNIIGLIYGAKVTARGGGKVSDFFTIKGAKLKGGFKDAKALEKVIASHSKSLKNMEHKLKFLRRRKRGGHSPGRKEKIKKTRGGDKVG